MNMKQRSVTARSWCGLFGLFILSGLFLPTQPEASEWSVGHLSQSLESLRDSSDHLVVVNDGLIIHTNSLKDKVGSLRAQSDRLEQQNLKLRDELVTYQSKTKDSAGLIEQNQTKVNDAKNRILRMDQDIEIKKLALAHRTRQQEYVFKLLKIVESGGTVEQNIQSVKMTQEQLIQKTDEGNARIRDLEEQWKQLSFWYGDASQTIEQLTITREQLKNKLVQLDGSGISEDWSGYQVQLGQLNREIQELSRVNSRYQKTLEDVENKYVGSIASNQSRSEERKLQQTLVGLKRDNKTLQRQAADLRYEMISLDKKKAQLESVLSENKQTRD